LGATKNVTPSEAAGAVYASATLNTVTGTDSSSINRFLYSQVDRGVVPKTAADACSSSFPCTSVNGSLSGLNVTLPSSLRARVRACACMCACACVRACVRWCLCGVKAWADQCAIRR
jgi:hypothetical protein